MAASLLELAVRIRAEDALKRLESAWLDEITDTYTRWIADALASGGGYEAVSAVLEDQAHAELIAKTEANRAWNSGAFEAYQKERVPQVVWITTSANPCPECVMNEAAGPWPLGKPFPSGVVMPPDHPNCQCHLEPA